MRSVLVYDIPGGGEDVAVELVEDHGDPGDGVTMMEVGVVLMVEVMDDGAVAPGAVEVEGEVVGPGSADDPIDAVASPEDVGNSPSSDGRRDRHSGEVGPSRAVDVGEYTCDGTRYIYRPALFISRSRPCWGLVWIALICGSRDGRVRIRGASCGAPCNAYSGRTCASRTRVRVTSR